MSLSKRSFDIDSQSQNATRTEPVLQDKHTVMVQTPYGAAMMVRLPRPASTDIISLQSHRRGIQHGCTVSMKNMAAEAETR